MDTEVARIYGKRVRIRVCGLLFQDESLLLVNHRLVNGREFWAPPGGGVEFNESIEACLEREVMEESGIKVNVLDFAFGCEFLKDPLHAIELFFWLERTSGELRKGHDPELQIIDETRFVSPIEIQKFHAEEVHGILRRAATKTQFLQLKGFYRI